eukprot:Gb_17415 [translate_table: standard]
MKNMVPSKDYCSKVSIYLPYTTTLEDSIDCPMGILQPRSPAELCQENCGLSMGRSDAVNGSYRTQKGVLTVVSAQTIPLLGVLGEILRVLNLERCLEEIKGIRCMKSSRRLEIILGKKVMHLLREGLLKSKKHDRKVDDQGGVNFGELLSVTNHYGLRGCFVVSLDTELMLPSAGIVDGRGNIDADINVPWNSNNKTMIKAALIKSWVLVNYFSRFSPTKGIVYQDLETQAKRKGSRDILLAVATSRAAEDRIPFLGNMNQMYQSQNFPWYIIPIKSFLCGLLQWMRSVLLQVLVNLYLSLWSCKNYTEATARPLVLGFLTQVTKVFITAGLLHWVEKGTTPVHIKDNSCGPHGCLTFYNSLYFIVVTISTVRYGDIMMKCNTGAMLLPYDMSREVVLYLKGQQISFANVGLAIAKDLSAAEDVPKFGRQVPFLGWKKICQLSSGGTSKKRAGQKQDKELLEEVKKQRLLQITAPLMKSDFSISSDNCKRTLRSRGCGNLVSSGHKWYQKNVIDEAVVDLLRILFSSPGLWHHESTINAGLGLAIQQCMALSTVVTIEDSKPWRKDCKSSLIGSAVKTGIGLGHDEQNAEVPNYRERNSFGLTLQADGTNDMECYKEGIFDPAFLCMKDGSCRSFLSASKCIKVFANQALGKMKLHEEVIKEKEHKILEGGEEGVLFVRLAPIAEGSFFLFEALVLSIVFGTSSSTGG